MIAQSPAVAIDPPKSCVHWRDPFVIAAAVIAAYVMLRDTELTNVQLSLVLVGVVLLIMVPVELARASWHNTPRPLIPFRETAKKACIKWLGLMSGLLLVLAAWHLVPEYQHKSYHPFFTAEPYVLPLVPFAVAVCVLWTEWRMGPVEDHAWHFGLVVLGRYKETDWRIIRDGLLGWLVKGFFLPLNFCTVVHKLYHFRGLESHILTASWPGVVNILDPMIFALLIVAIIPGYLFSARMIGTENKRIEYRGSGWAATLLCYPPINRGAHTGWFSYHGHGTAASWVSVFGASGTASYIAGSALIFFFLVHYWGEAICCLRSSHLTNRGIITNGPFRFCKHPVYTAKCFAWGLAIVPFLAGKTLSGDITCTLAFLALCGVYVMRGWVEERLLSTDETYVAYALWMEQHSIFRAVGRRIPFFSYTWRLQKWRKTGQL